MCDNIQTVSYKKCLPTFEGSPDDALGYIDLQYNPQAFKLPHSSSQSKFNSLPNIKSRRRSHYISNLENNFYPKSDKLDNLTMDVTPTETENKTVEPTKDEDTESKTSESTTVVISTSDSVCSDSPRGVTNEAFEDDEEVDSPCKKGHRRTPSTSNLKDEKSCNVSYSSAGSSAIEIPIPMTKEDLKAKELSPEYQLVMPDTQLRKGWRGEKLYFAKGNADPRAERHVRRFCWWMVCLVLLAGAITVAGLIGVGVIKLPLHIENERIHGFHSRGETGPRIGQVRDQDAPQGTTRMSIIDTIVIYDYETRTEEEDLIHNVPRAELLPITTTDRIEYTEQTTTKHKGTTQADYQTTTKHMGTTQTDYQTTKEKKQTVTHEEERSTSVRPNMEPRQLNTQTEQAMTQTEQFNTQTEESVGQTEQVNKHTEQTNTQTEQVTTQTEQFNTQTEQSVGQTEQVNVHTEQVDVHTEQVSTQTEQAIVQKEEVNTQTEQSSTQTDETPHTTITKEISTQTKTEKAPVETTQILGDQSAETTTENKQTTSVPDIETTTEQKQGATEQGVTFTTSTQTTVFVKTENEEGVLVEGSGEVVSSTDEVGSGIEMDPSKMGLSEKRQKLKTISVEGLFKEEFEASGDDTDLNDVEQLELNTDYVMTRELDEDNEDGEMELVITLPELLTGNFRDIIEGDEQEGSGDNSFELNQPPESTGKSFENGEDVFKALLDLILPKKSERVEGNSNNNSLGELIKHIGSQ